MPATYTYNDAIEDAKGVVAKAIEEDVGTIPSAIAEPHVKLLLKIIGQLDELKRRPRRKRSTSVEVIASP